MKGAIYIARTTSGRGSAVARAAWNTRTTDSLALDSILSVVAHRRTLPQHPRPLPLPVSAVCSSNASFCCSWLLPPSFSSFLLTSTFSYIRECSLHSLRTFVVFSGSIPIHHHFLSRFPSFHRTVANETVNYANDIIVVFCRLLTIVSFPSVFFYHPPLLKTLRGVHSCRERHPT